MVKKSKFNSNYKPNFKLIDNMEAIERMMLEDHFNAEADLTIFNTIQNNDITIDEINTDNIDKPDNFKRTLSSSPIIQSNRSKIIRSEFNKDFTADE